MSLLALGLNHTTAPVELRERVAFTPERVPEALKTLNGLPRVHESAILSTCNRTEIFCNAHERCQEDILEWLGDFHQIHTRELKSFFYIHQEQEAVSHLLAVASGLNSMVLGEPQILGQVKQAYQLAKAEGTVGRLLNRLFQYTFKVAKQVRTDTAIGGSAVSVAFAAVRLARQIFGDFPAQTALLIGAGETIELTARHLHEHGMGRMIVANRTLERAHTLAQEFGGYAISLEEIPSHLAEASLVISSTASKTPVLTRDMLIPALQSRSQRSPMLMIDLAVPRDIDPSVDKLEDIYLYTVDHMQEIIDEGLQNRREAAQQAEEIIANQAAAFMRWVQAQTYTRDIQQFRQMAHDIQKTELDQALAMLQRGTLSPEQALQHLAHNLTNKLIHTPTIQMKQAAQEGREDTLDAARELFNLRKHDPSQ